MCGFRQRARQDQPRDQIGPVGGKLQGDRTAHRVTENHRRTAALGLDHRGDAGGLMRQRGLARRRGVRATGPGAIRGKHAPAVQKRGQAGKIVGHAAKAVDQHRQRRAGFPFGDDPAQPAVTIAAKLTAHRHRRATDRAGHDAERQCRQRNA